MGNHHTPRRAPPAHLTAEGRALWSRLYRERTYNETSSLLLLTSLCEAHDRARQCREALNGAPLTVTDKHGGVRINCLLVEERAQREQMMRLARVLRIHLEPPEDNDAA